MRTRGSAPSPLFLLSTRDDFVEWWTRSLPSDLHPFDRNGSLITATMISIFRCPITEPVEQSDREIKRILLTHNKIVNLLWPSYYCFFFFGLTETEWTWLIAICSLFDSISLATVLFLLFLSFLFLSVFLKSIGLPA